ncbi:hypothetical protein, partial [Porphyromonas asaccharolytica]|uniref:hypothetical protein n=1 Tax=Porphyromonas asaccharolytica TaxID=28123 RepID=UPI00248E69E2
NYAPCGLSPQMYDMPVIHAEVLVRAVDSYQDFFFVLTPVRQKTETTKRENCSPRRKSKILTWERKIFHVEKK